MFWTKPPNGHQPRDTEVQLHLLRLLCNLLVPQKTAQRIPEQLLTPNVMAGWQGTAKPGKTEISKFRKFMQSSHLPGWKENLSAGQGSLQCPRGTRQMGLMGRELMGRINPGTERSWGCAGKKSNRRTKKEGPSTFQGKRKPTKKEKLEFGEVHAGRATQTTGDKTEEFGE